MLNRRKLLAGTAGLLASQQTALAGNAPVSPGVPNGVVDNASLEALPGKKPLIKLSFRPPNYETPISYFKDTITPNDAFFVRYHLADIPEVAAETWSLSIGGGANPLKISLDQLKNDFPATEVVAVCQCSGNRRGLSSPHVAGVEWGYGAMGNARWKGARLKDILAKAGVPKEAVEIVFHGTDGPPNPKTPRFIKSLPIWKAIDENTLVAYEMNGEPLPRWNGFPARLVVPGWTATYWMKHVSEINFVDKPFDGFWMKAAYRVPIGLFPSVDRFVSQETAVNTPITEMMVNSLITSHQDGQKAPAGKALMIDGVAWDSGRGVTRVDVSIDGGHSWKEATLGPDMGRFSFRRFGFGVSAPKRGKLLVMARAINKSGQAQVDSPIFNPAGYHHNALQKITLDIA